MSKGPDIREDLVSFQTAWLKENIYRRRRKKKIIGNEVKKVAQSCSGF